MFKLFRFTALTCDLNQCFFPKISDPHSSPLAPLNTQDQDTLQRYNLVDNFFQLITNADNHIRTFSVTGKPGVGKTSIVNLLQEKLKKKHPNRFHIIYFDAHFYKDSHKLLQAYARAIIQEIEKHEYLPSEFKIIFDKIINAAIDHANKKLLTSIDLRSDFPLEKLISDLTDIISKCHRQIILFVDDIDRLDKDELTAVLNITRLLKSTNPKEKPKLLQVLCYNRNYIDQNLYGNSAEDRSKSQECLSKIIDEELPIPVLAEKFAHAALSNEFAMLVNEIIPDDKKQKFKAALEGNLSTFCKIILTMRQARKIVYHTLDLYMRDKHGYNLWDLFILTMLQYCFPDAYNLMEKYPEWFQHWNNQLNEIQYSVIKSITNGNTTGSTEHYYSHYSRLRDISLTKLYPDQIDQQLVGLLLRLLNISTIFGGYNSKFDDTGNLKITYSPHTPSESDAQLDEESCLCHPNHYLRYFYHADLNNEVSAAEINALTSIITKDTFSDSFKSKLSEVSNQDRLYQFLDRWTVKTNNKLKEWDNNTLEKIAILLAESSHLFIKTPSFSTYDHESHIALNYLKKIIRVLSDRGSNGSSETTNLVENIVKKSTYLYFSGLLIYYINRPDREKMPEGIVDATRINAAFSQRIKDDFQQESIFVGVKGYDLIAIVCWLKDNNIKKEYLLRDLTNDPHNIFNIIGTSLHPNGYLAPELHSYLPFIKDAYSTVANKINISMLSEKHRMYWKSLEEFLIKNYGTLPIKELENT